MIAQCRTAADPRHVSRGAQRYLERNMDNIVITPQSSGYLYLIVSLYVLVLHLSMSVWFAYVPEIVFS